MEEKQLTRYTKPKTSYFKSIQDTRSLHGVMSVDSFLLSDLSKLSNKPEEWTVCCSFMFIC